MDSFYGRGYSLSSRCSLHFIIDRSISLFCQNVSNKLFKVLDKNKCWRQQQGYSLFVLLVDSIVALLLTLVLLKEKKEEKNEKEKMFLSFISFSDREVLFAYLFQQSILLVIHRGYHSFEFV